MLLMGESTISTGPFSIANCLFTRGYNQQYDTLVGLTTGYGENHDNPF